MSVRMNGRMDEWIDRWFNWWIINIWIYEVKTDRSTYKRLNRKIVSVKKWEKVYKCTRWEFDIKRKYITMEMWYNIHWNILPGDVILFVKNPFQMWCINFVLFVCSLCLLVFVYVYMFVCMFVYFWLYVWCVI